MTLQPGFHIFNILPHSVIVKMSTDVQGYRNSSQTDIYTER